MFTHGKVSSSEALRLISESVMEAAKIEKHIAIAICGPEGELIAFLRMDGASAAAARIAQNKAYTSGRDRKSTKAMGEFMRDEYREQGYWG
ncbi:MAG TPA: heme-binding protein, partial [Ohtaekwangia sp.]